MSGSATTYLTARFLTPDYLIRGATQTLSCPIWRDGGLVAPTQAGSTVSIYDASNTAIVSAAAVTVTGSIATYSLSSSLVPTTLALGMGWRVEWSLVVSGVLPSPTTYRNSAGLVRSELAPVVTDADLFRRESSLNPDGTAPISSLDDYQDFIDEAWITLHGRLVARGNLPHRILEPSALREPHLLLALHLVFNDLRTRLNETYSEKAKEYLDRFEKSYSDLAVEYDSADSGASDGRRKRSMSPTVWLGGFD